MNRECDRLEKSPSRSNCATAIECVVVLFPKEVSVLPLDFQSIVFPRGIAGKNSRPEFQAPCRTTKYPREIPHLPWYRRTLPQQEACG
ncbi:transmembrane 9 superfamily member 2-like [Senna tora]|uniref:Transmembrane 9 superfamily member 2-like n=1 Tax=Senna tora TaxID=362788 RepID=A0A834WYQ4_9FABA|nr:transmembrane 9 superfamily member 2-like [Senna tora]